MRDIKEKNTNPNNNTNSDNNTNTNNNSNNNSLNINDNSKFVGGAEARSIWSKPIKNKDLVCFMKDYNNVCDNQFVELGEIVLDDSKKISTLKVEIKDKDLWTSNDEFIYTIVKDGYIVKIGGTRVGMEKRWHSYKSGHCVPQRKNTNGKSYSGKMSVTNAYVYHTIEDDLLKNDSKWKIYGWKLPIVKHKIEILGEDIEIILQTFHAYETRCIEKYKKIADEIPILCNNYDKTYCG